MADSRTLLGAGIRYGAAVYPEVTGIDTLARDAEHMARLGMDAARLGEFMWAALEPAEGAIDASLLVESVEVLASRGLRSIVATPTAAPPVWYTHGRPNRLHRTAEGLALGHGSRQQACERNTDFRAAASRITDAIAAALAGNRGVLAWQVDNELRSHVTECFCAACASAWPEWLRRRHGEVGALNAAWSSAIWSETYQELAQVPLPGPTPFLHATGLLADFRRFSREGATDFVRGQAAVIRRHSALPVTHNSGLGFALDNAALFEDLEFSAFDSYAAADNYPAFLLNLDLFAHLGPAGRTVVMETSPSHAGSVRSQPRPHPAGYVAAEAFASAAADAAGFLFWHFRQHAGGSEQPHGSVLSAWGAPTIGYAAAERAGKLLAQLGPLLRASKPVPPAVAISWSDDARGYLDAEPLTGGDYRTHVSRLHARLVRAGVRRAALPDGAGPSEGLRVMITAFRPWLPADELERWLAWVRDGGTWVVGPHTGTRTEHHGWHTDAALGALESAAGVEGVYQFPAAGTGTRIRLGGREAEFDGPLTALALRGATALATIESGPAAGLAAVTEHRIGAGRLILVGGFPADDGACPPPDGSAAPAAAGVWDALLAHALRDVDDPALPTEPGVVEYARRGPDGLEHWLVNLDGAERAVTLGGPARSLLTGHTHPAGRVALPAYGWAVLAESADPSTDETPESPHESPHDSSHKETPHAVA
ncbi:beta-galactosidase [Sinomonas sp. P47F7]|uniref:beta-galactosidase n=1 Tax=Sinomonas sp. P47F7 TaxID=3410987 RepID=UPI003BF467D6